MKPLGSSLNPYATSYIPLSMREANKSPRPENSSVERMSVFPGYSGYAEHYMHNRQYENISPRLNLRHGEKSPVAVGSAVKNHTFRGPVSQHSNELAEMELLGREFSMDLEFLQASFPGLSEQSLSDVYLANNCDLDAAIDMLSLLENKHAPDFEYDPESLPDTLDIGDISEPGFAAVGQPSFRTKNVANGASTSSRF